MVELAAIVWHYVRPWYWSIMVICLALTIYDLYIKEEPKRHKESYWLNEDPTRHKESYWLNEDPTRDVTDISGLDYDNRLIIYRPQGEHSKRSIRDVSISKGVADDWYDILDYYDLYEYYHD